MQKDNIGVSLIALIITIIIIIILAAIVILPASGMLENTNYAKFTHELSEIEESTKKQRALNAVRGVREVLNEDHVTFGKK